MKKFLLPCFISIFLMLGGCSPNREISGEINLENNDKKIDFKKTSIVILTEDNFIKYYSNRQKDSSEEIDHLKKKIVDLDEVIEKYTKNISPVIIAMKKWTSAVDEHSSIVARNKVEMYNLMVAASAGLNTARRESEIKISDLNAQKKIINTKFDAIEAANKAAKNYPSNDSNEVIKNATNDNLELKDAVEYTKYVTNILDENISKKEKIENDIELLKKGLSGKFYTENIKVDHYSEASPDDIGKFILKAKDGKYALLASNLDNQWILWLDVNEKSKRIQLDKNNLVSSECDACILKSKKE